MKNPHNDVISLDFEADEPLSERTERYFSICKEKLGLVPNVLKAYSFNAEKLNSFTALYNDLMLGASGLTKLQREMIAVVVSSHNKCFYCLTAHGAAVRELSGDPALGEMLVMNFRAADLDPKDRAMLDFAHKLTAHASEVDEPDRQALRDAGWSDRDIWDIANVTGFFNMTNRVATATDMRPNDEYHGQVR
ncbi:peroxidase-related enzyme [Ahrensia sp. R2A130]|uniref:peroxidase-related enzyme n=1 Tax=Ahrensia sp. R2A130 TaxID=744979 RepID=UPI0001E08C96|nr:peroxidase-related enzyme [Ahrensia sp. R2A130]EFL88112.1 alkylhydroperoxidase [Ahrensia sp. R2A130]